MSFEFVPDETAKLAPPPESPEVENGLVFVPDEEEDEVSAPEVSRLRFVPDAPETIIVPPVVGADTPEGVVPTGGGPDLPAVDPERTPPIIQRMASFFGVEPQPVPEAPEVIEFPERPAALRTLEQITGDIRSVARWRRGQAPVPAGNIPAKAAALREDAEKDQTPLSEKSELELVAAIPKNAYEELVEIPIGFGLLMGRAMREVGEFGANVLRTAKQAGVSQRTVTVGIPNEETGALESVTLPYGNIRDLPEDLRDRLVRLGARFGPEPDFEPGMFEGFWGDLATQLGFPEVESLSEDATTFGIPLIDTDSKRVFSPRTLLEQTSEHPISQLINGMILMRVPSLAARAGAATARTAGRTSARAGAVSMDRAFAQAGLKLDDFADKADAVTSFQAVERLTRKGLELSPMGRKILANHDAKLMVRTLVAREKETAFAQTAESQKEIYRALRDVPADELRLIPAVLEGRAELIPGATSPQLARALDVTKRNIRKHQQALMDRGLLTGDVVANRAYGPLVVTKTGKLIPEKDWTAARVQKENARIANLNKGLDPSERPFPSYMTHGEHTRELKLVRDEWEATRQNVRQLPRTAELEPTYFPRFAPDPKIRDILREFMPSALRKQARQPFQKHFTGASILRNADPVDVRRALLEHNTRVRRALDNLKLIDELKASPMTKPLRLDSKGNPIDLLPDHVPFNPDGHLLFWRKQLNLGEETAKALDSMGDFESALAEGIRVALSDNLQMTVKGASRRTNMFQVPTGAAKELERTFRPPTAAARVFWDKPTDVWKMGVLAYSPRWHVNNMVGGTVLGSLAGVPPWRLAKPISAAERLAVPERMGAQTFIFSEMIAPRLGAAPLTASGGVARAVANAAPVRLPVSGAQAFADFSFGVNSAVDKHFRQRVYLGKAHQRARTELIKETGSNLVASRDILMRMQRFAKDPKVAQELLNATDRVFFNFNRLSPTERRYARRVMPFWSWYREIARITANMPSTRPVRAKLVQGLSDAVKDADGMEFRRHVGIPKEFGKEYLQDQTFVGLDNEGQISFLSARGANVLYGATFVPIKELQGRIHPALQFLINESTGGRTMGKWGTFVPFRFEEAGKRMALDPETGEMVDKNAFRGAPHRLARLIPLTQLVEDLAQYATEGQITQRFEDVTPLRNVGPAATGGAVKPTAVPRLSENLAPVREKTLGQVLGAFFGVTTSQYLLEEILEAEVKTTSADLSVIFSRKYASDPEFRRRFDEIVRERTGEKFEGLRTLKPSAEKSKGGTR